MSLQFAIIPINKKFLGPAYEIQCKIKKVSKNNTYILVDTEFDLIFNRRISKWTKNNFNVIIINEEYNESYSIIVRLFDKGTKPQVMDIEELIELIKYFDDDDERNYSLDKLDNKSNETSNETSNEISNGNCNIM